jgi:L-asparaginase II
VPENAFAGDVPLVSVERGGFVGSLHRGTAAVVEADGGLVLALGDTDQPVFLRSSAKPFQAMPALLTGGVDRFGLSERELAVLCASHSAEPRHMEAVLGVLARLDLPESALRCGAHQPIDETTFEVRLRAGIEPTPVCNNCSGAHSGMLVACRAMGWPLDSYGSPEHPLQVMTREILATFAGLEPSGIELGIDNCAVPTFRLPLRHAALAFARLSSGEGVPARYAEAAARIRAAMTRFPEMIAGEGRFDTALMRVVGGRLVAKGGAEAFQGVGWERHGLALKISDGNDRAVPPATLAILARVDALRPAELAGLERWSQPIQENLRGEPVGRLFPLPLGGER